MWAGAGDGGHVGQIEDVLQPPVWEPYLAGLRYSAGGLGLGHGHGSVDVVLQEVQRQEVGE